MRGSSSASGGPCGAAWLVKEDLTIWRSANAHDGWWPSQVTYLGAYFMARSMGAALFTGNVAENNEVLYGFEWADGESSTGSIAVGFDFGAPAVPRENRPPLSAFDTHEDVRRDPRAQEQMHAFFSTGIIPDVCNGQGCYSTQ